MRLALSHVRNQLWSWVKKYSLQIVIAILTSIAAGFLVNSVIRPVYRLDAVRSAVYDYGKHLVVPPEAEGIVSVQVLFNGNPVSDLQQLTVELRNSGNRPIREDDYESLSLVFPGSVALLSVVVSKKPREEMSFVASLEEPPGRVPGPEGDLSPWSQELRRHRVRIEFKIMKPGETVSLAIFFVGNLPKGWPRLEGHADAILRPLDSQDGLGYSRLELYMLAGATTVMLLAFLVWLAIRVQWFRGGTG